MSPPGLVGEGALGLAPGEAHEHGGGEEGHAHPERSLGEHQPEVDLDVQQGGAAAFGAPRVGPLAQVDRPGS